MSNAECRFLNYLARNFVRHFIQPVVYSWYCDNLICVSRRNTGLISNFCIHLQIKPCIDRISCEKW